MARVIPARLLAVLMLSSLAATVAAQGVVVRGGARSSEPVPPPGIRVIPVGTSSIAGIVSAGDTGRPIRGALVSINGDLTPFVTRAGGFPAAAPAPPAGRPQGPGAAVAGPTSAVAPRAAPQPDVPLYLNRSTSTDDQGAFLIDRLPAGQYTLTVSAPSGAFLQFAYGQKRPNGPTGTFALPDGQRARMDVRLIRTGLITGIALGEDGDPVAGAQVQAWRFSMENGVKRLQQMGYAQADDRGTYRLFGLQPGDYLVSASPGWDRVQLGSDAAGDRDVIERAIASGALRPPAAPGYPASVSLPAPTPDEQRQRRTFDQPRGFLPVFYPGAQSATSASVIHVGAGDERAGVDIFVRRITSTNVQGDVQNMPGKGRGVQLTLVNDDPLMSQAGGARADKAGHFVFNNIAPGHYTIVAQVITLPSYTVVDGEQVNTTPPAPLDDAQRAWGRTAITVDGQPTVTADVTMKPGFTVSGRVIFEMQRPPDLAKEQVSIHLAQAPGGSFIPTYGSQPEGRVAPDGSFSIQGVMPGRYVLNSSRGPQKSALVNGQDALDFPFEVSSERGVYDAVMTITDKYSQVSGYLIDTAGKIGAGATVIAATTDARYWTPGSRRVMLTSTGRDGRYSFGGLPPGEYLLAVVNDVEPGSQYDPEFLRSLCAVSSMRIVVTDGAKITQDLRAVR